MRRTVNIWVLIGALFCVLVAFFCMSSSLSVPLANWTMRTARARLVWQSFKTIRLR